MNPGIYLNLPIEAYHSSAGYSSSQLKTLLKSPYLFHYLYIREAPLPNLIKWGTTRRPLAIGGATAALMDSQEVFDTGYIVLDAATSKASKNAKVFKEAFALATTDNPGKTVILYQEYEQAQAIAEAAHNHPDVWTRDQLNGLLDSPELRSECSYYHRDDETGLLVKTRPDFGIPRALHADVKTTADCGPWAFSKRILDNGHHIQAAMGLDISNHVEHCVIENWLLIVIEQSPPYDVAAYYLGKPTLAKGYERYRFALRRLRACLDADEWPGKQSGINQIDIPAYALNEKQEQEEHIFTGDSQTGVIR